MKFIRNNGNLYNIENVEAIEFIFNHNDKSLLKLTYQNKFYCLPVITSNINETQADINNFITNDSKFINIY